MSLCLVTGGAGFIGNHVVRRLLRDGKRVRVLDDLSTGNKRNLADVGDHIEFVEADICNVDAVSGAMRGVETVFHLAARASVPRSVEHPRQSHDTNVNGTFNLLRAAVQQRVRRVIYAASSSAYGNTKESPKHEGIRTEPLSPYAVQKLLGEQYARAFTECYGLETISLRYFNVFGPRQAFDSPYSGVIAKFCTAMLAGQAPVIFGDGSQARDFTFVDNAVAANLRAAEAPAEKAAGKFFNVACGGSIDLLQLVKDINHLTGQQLQPRFEPRRAGDILHSLADISAARECLGYEPKVSWEEGLRRTLEFYRAEA